MNTVADNANAAIEGLQRLCATARAIKLADNDPLYRQGETCRNVYVLVRGHIKLSRITAQGEQRTLVILPVGEIVGALPTAQPNLHATDTATAKGKAELYCFPRAQFLTALADDGSIASFVVKRLATRQAFMTARIEQLLGSDVRRRVAATLFELTGAYGGRCAHGHQVDVRLTQQELAEMTGARRPTVSTVLNQLRERGIVSYTRSYICIEDMRALGNVFTRDD